LIHLIEVSWSVDMIKIIKILVLLLSLTIISGTALSSNAIKFSAINSEEDVTLTSNDNVKTETVCFTAHNGVDPVPVTITGTLFHKGVYKPSSKVIIAVHGFVNDRRIWDGGSFDPVLEESYARALANAGYVVITYDRLGYGQSPYLNDPGAGFTITLDNQLGILKEIIAQIKDGSYKEGYKEGMCSSGTSAGIRFKKDPILIGHSGGASLIESYAGLYHDVSAIIPMAYSSVGLNDEFMTDIINGWIVPEIGTYPNLKDYVTMFPPNPEGHVSEKCVDYFFDKSGAYKSIYNNYCANQNLIPSPSGEYLSAFEFWGKTHDRIKTIEKKLPVLLVFADNDRLFGDTQSLEVEYWRQNCNCDLSIIEQTKSGHMLMLHKSNKAAISAIIDWLGSHGL
jgi:pimeloyl-ACP methyl ester carboxylesterase